MAMNYPFIMFNQCYELSTHNVIENDFTIRTDLFSKENKG